MTRLRSAGLFIAGAALSAALLITGTQAWQVGAAPGDTDATYQPLSPCRLMDTRVDFNVGARKAPIGPAETYTAQVTGTNGNCVDVPAGATGVAMNVTVLNATAPSNLRVFPADLVDVPLVSNLNYSQTSPPTANKVDSKLSPDGKIKIFNAFGTVDVIVDIVGVYTNTSLVALQADITSLRADIAALQSDVTPAQSDIVALRDDVDRLDMNRPIIARSNNVFVEATLTGEFREISVVGFTAPAQGRVYVHAQGSAIDFDAGEDVHCTIGRDAPTTTASAYWPRWEAAGQFGGPNTEGDAGVMAVSEVFDVEAGQESFRMYCKNTSANGTSELWGPTMFAVYVPD